MQTYKAEDASLEIIEECSGAQEKEISCMFAAAKEAFRIHDISRPFATIAIVDDERMRELNTHYRDINSTTDVLSFAANEGQSLASPSKRNFLGDIAISLPRARAQAQEYGHSLSRELAFLTVHGLLHLLGYDHMNELDAAEMYSLQEEVLKLAKIARE